MKMTSIKWALSISAAAVLVACGGGGGGTEVATSNATVSLAPTAAAAVTSVLAAAGTNGITVTAPTAVSATTSSGASVTIPAAATIKLTTPSATGSAAAFNISSTRGVVAGNMSLGSCIFAVTSSTDPQIPVGTTFTVASCNMSVGTAGATTNSTGQASVSLSLNNVVTSASAPIAVQVTSTGAVIINGTTISTITVGITGA